VKWGAGLGDWLRRGGARGGSLARWRLPSRRVLGARRLRDHPVIRARLRCLQDDRASAPTSPGPSTGVPPVPRPPPRRSAGPRSWRCRGGVPRDRFVSASAGWGGVVGLSRCRGGVSRGGRAWQPVLRSRGRHRGSGAQPIVSAQGGARVGRRRRDPARWARRRVVIETLVATANDRMNTEPTSAEHPPRREGPPSRGTCRVPRPPQPIFEPRVSLHRESASPRVRVSLQRATGARRAGRRGRSAGSRRGRRGRGSRRWRG
jgi:hypothetical protein